MARGSLITKIIYAVTGFANQCSYVTVSATTGNANTVITDIGLLFIKTPASVSIQLQDPGGTWTDIVPASTSNPVLVPSDGMNLRVHSADTTTNRSANYWVIQ